MFDTGEDYVSMNRSRRSVVRGVAGVVGLGGLGALVHAGDGAGDGATSRTQALVAGSLLRFATELSGATVEAHGSRAVQQLILNEMRSPDAVALADPRLFDGIAGRVTLFATNALVVAYDPQSVHAGALRSDWQAAVEREEIRLGRTDPAVDPLGYRTMMALRLAESAYGLDRRRVLDDATVRAETDLLNVVETGKLDAAFAYRNMAVQRDLPFVELPDRIDFSNPAYADVYRTVSADLGGQTVDGAPIRYAATTLTTAGESWVERLVTARERLRTAGFVVPSDYPRRDSRVPESGDHARPDE
jgi:molybdate/tungstate transport system substrate-binding protein